VSQQVKSKTRAREEEEQMLNELALEEEHLRNIRAQVKIEEDRSMSLQYNIELCTHVRLCF